MQQTTVLFVVPVQLLLRVYAPHDDLGSENDGIYNGRQVANTNPAKAPRCTVRRRPQQHQHRREPNIQPDAGIPPGGGDVVPARPGVKGRDAREGRGQVAKQVGGREEGGEGEEGEEPAARAEEQRDVGQGGEEREGEEDEAELGVAGGVFGGEAERVEETSKAEHAVKLNLSQRWRDAQPDDDATCWRILPS
ncbi:hypothetical protein TOPH_00861 [Tolypocladium ophioglossoides CBS 100239]|uniref:Uncharacterized protein n=1 Tax=Tolypocladium ophioglossoides (strain CBS 100239) TaxID=1163406 RepID=A0A0L0NJF6_TOLOC|nr:hypothetical protein TOPH_00861 [Tolypocladium ophioglossoides CBS 100239]